MSNMIEMNLVEEWFGNTKELFEAVKCELSALLSITLVAIIATDYFGLFPSILIAVILMVPFMIMILYRIILLGLAKSTRKILDAQEKMLEEKLAAFEEKMLDRIQEMSLKQDPAEKVTTLVVDPRNDNI